MDAKPSRSRPLALLTVVGLIALVLIIDMRRRAAEDQLAKMSVQMNQVNGGDREQNKQAAQEIINRVRKLMDIPEGTEPTVATIVDVESLREKNPFYAKAENGDHLIITKDRAILYSPTKNMIVDVVPVQVQPPAQGAAASVQVDAEETPPRTPTPAPAAVDAE